MEMESDKNMKLTDLPVETRNYKIIDNITGKAIDQKNYSLNIDTAVVGNLNKLKQINEEKTKQANLRSQYGEESLVTTFTPDNNNVFTPVFNEEYINYHDFNDGTQQEEVAQEIDAEVVESQINKKQTRKPQEVIQSETLLNRVVARDEEARLAAIAEEEAKNEVPEELDYISAYDLNSEYAKAAEQENAEQTEATDNSTVFTPTDNSTLKAASEQIVKIDTKKKARDIKPTKNRLRVDNIKLEKIEIQSGKKVAWLSYILFFIPLLFKGKNRYVRLHANEGLEINLMELVGGLLIAQYFILPLVTTLSTTMVTISLALCIIGAGIAGAAVLCIIPMMIMSMCGLQVQSPLFFVKRIIKVPTERLADD